LRTWMGRSPPSRMKMRAGFWLGLQPYFSSSSFMSGLLSCVSDVQLPVDVLVGVPGQKGSDFLVQKFRHLAGGPAHVFLRGHLLLDLPTGQGEEGVGHDAVDEVVLSALQLHPAGGGEIGRASCRERERRSRRAGAV